MKKFRRWLVVLGALAVLCVGSLIGACSLNEGKQSDGEHDTDDELLENVNPCEGYLDFAYKQIYEAEDADTLANGCYTSASDSCSGGMRLINMSATSSAYADYTITSQEAGFADLSVKMTYVRDETSMGKVIEVTLNGETLDLSDKPVYHTCNNYDTYYEFPLGKISLNEGENKLRITSIGGGFYIDYFALSSPKMYEGGTFIAEAENADVACEAYPVEASEASCGRVLDYKASGKFTVTFYTQEAMLSQLSVCFAYVGYDGSGTRTFNNVMKITVNGRSMTLGDTTVYPGGDYVTIPAGNVFLRKGENKIVVQNYSRFVLYDCLIFAEAEKAEVKEGQESVVQAESAALLDGNRSELQKDGSVAVVNNNANSSAIFLVYAESNFSTELSLCMKYSGKAEKLSRIMYITVNGYLVNLGEIASKANSGAGFTVYRIGGIALSEGVNVISITAIDGEYSLDYLLFS